MALSDKVSSIITIVLFSYLIYSVFIDHKELESNYNLDGLQTSEITNITAVLNKTGQLVSTGWMRKAPPAIDPGLIYPVWFGLGFMREVRVKKWDYFAFQFDTKLIQIVTADVYYAVSSFVNVHDFSTGLSTQFQHKLLPVLDRNRFPKLTYNISGCPAQAYTFAKDNYTVNMNQAYNETSKVCAFNLLASIDGRFAANLTSERDLTQDEIFEVFPVSENRRYFSHALKSLNNRCYGHASVDGQAMEAKLENCNSMMDQARSLPFYKTSWVWASAAGFAKDGSRLSLHFAEGVSTAKEVNVIFTFKVNGTVIEARPGPIVFDRSNLMAGFWFKTAAFYEGKNNWMDVKFMPAKDLLVTENVLVVSTRLHYLYGTFTGKVTNGEGKVLEFEGLRGLVEVAKMKW